MKNWKRISGCLLAAMLPGCAIAKNEVAGIQIRKPSRIKLINKSKYLYALIALPVVYYIVFHYAPMYGILVSFKDYNIVKGIIGSPWAGFKWYEKFLSDPYFWKVVRNTFLLSLENIAFGFPFPIIIALLLNEVRNKKFKKGKRNTNSKRPVRRNRKFVSRFYCSN